VLGLQLSLRRFISFHIEKQEMESVRGLISIGIVWPAVVGLFIGGLLFVGAGWLARSVFGKPEVAPVLTVLAFVVPMWATRRLATVIYSGFKKPLYKVALEDVLEPLLRVGTAVVVGIGGWGALQLGYGTLAAYGVVVLVAWYLVDRGRRQIVGRGPRHVPWRELVAFSTPLVVSEFGNIILAWAGILLLGLLSVEREVGLFRAVSQPPMLASAMLTSFNFVYLPMATALFVRGNHAEWNRINAAVARWTLSLSFPIATVCALFPTEVIRVVFGQQYTSGAMAMQLMALAYLIHAGCGFAGLNLVVAGHTWLQMTATLLAIATNIALSLVWIPRYGAAGAAGALLAMSLVRNAFNLTAMKAVLRLFPFNRRYVAVLVLHLISAGSLTVTVYLMRISPVAAMFTVGALELPVAFLLGYLVGVVDKRDLDLIRRLRKARVRRNAH
jgi:O-antigen/teichoic acid export membrane protein